ncbi:MAG: ATPase, T2SS/T4P/T4SS family, partial [Candidatus Eremiobacterota bacterium]
EKLQKKLEEEELQKKLEEEELQKKLEEEELQKKLEEEKIQKKFEEEKIQKKLEEEKIQKKLEEEGVEIIEVVDGEWEGDEEEVEIIEVVEDDWIEEDEKFDYVPCDRIYLNLIQELLSKDFSSLTPAILTNRPKLDQRFFEIIDYKMQFAIENDQKLANDLSYLNSIMTNLRLRDNMVPPYVPSQEELETLGILEELRKQQEQPLQKEEAISQQEEEFKKPEEELLIDKYEREIQYILLAYFLIRAASINEIAVLIHNYNDLLDDKFFENLDEIFYNTKNSNKKEIIAKLIYLNKIFIYSGLKKKESPLNPYLTEDLSGSPDMEEISEEDIMAAHLSDTGMETKEISIKEPDTKDKKNYTPGIEDRAVGEIFIKEYVPGGFTHEEIQSRIQIACGDVLADSYYYEPDDRLISKEHDYLMEKNYRKPSTEELQESTPPASSEVPAPYKEEPVTEAVSEIDLPGEGEEKQKEEPKQITYYETILENYLLMAIDKGASNLHLTVNSPPVMRIYKEIQKMELPIITSDFTQYFVDNMLTETQRRAFLYNKNLEMTYEFIKNEKNYRFKVNIYEHLNGINANFWFIPPVIPSLKELNLPDIISSLIYYKSGLIIIASPSKGGKSTTLNSLLNIINEERSSHIITIENPIEYIHHYKKSIIRQKQIGIHSETFKGALNFSIKENPDIIVIGDCNDYDTLYRALLAAETGKLVFITVTATDSISAINTILNLFSDEEEIKDMFSAELKAIVSQHLLPGLNKDCIIPAVEILLGCERLSDIIKNDMLFEIYNLINDNSKAGMISLDNSLLNLYKGNLISRETALELAQDQTRFL